MLVNKIKVIAIFAIVFIASCSRESEVGLEKDEQTSATGVLSQSQIDAINNAEGIGNILQQAEEKRRKQMDGTE